MTRKLLQPDILRHIEKSPTYARKLAEAVAENLAVCRHGKAAVRHGHPLLKGSKARARAGFCQIEVARFYHSVAAASDWAYFKPVHTLKALGELRIGALEPKLRAAVDIIRDKNAEARFKIMVARDIVVIAEALRAVADKTYGKLILKLGELLAKHRRAVGFIKPS